MNQANATDASQIYLINLDRSTDRLSAFWERNRHLEGRIQRVSAINGATLDRAALKQSGYIEDDLPYGAGTLGCAMSHIKLWEMAVAENRSIMIFEDDVVVSNYFEQKRRQVLSMLPDDWDVIQWGYGFNPLFVWVRIGKSKVVMKCYGGVPPIADREFQEDDVHPTAFGLLHSYGTQAYSISSRGARAALEHCLPLRKRMIKFEDAGVTTPDEGIDAALCDLYPNIKAFICVPQLVRQASDLSSARLQVNAERRSALPGSSSI